MTEEMFPERPIERTRCLALHPEYQQFRPRCDRIYRHTGVHECQTKCYGKQFEAITWPNEDSSFTSEE